MRIHDDCLLFDLGLGTLVVSHGKHLMINPFDFFLVAVSEEMACHVNFDFSVCGQGYFHRKITIVFKFSRFLYSIGSLGDTYLCNIGWLVSLH